MIKKQQKWIALLVVCTFIWLMQVSTMPVAAAGTTEQISSASAEQGPDYYEAVSQKAAPAKKKSILPIILIGVGVFVVTAAVLFLLLKTKYDITGSWTMTRSGTSSTRGFTFVGDKKSGTLTVTGTTGGLDTGTYTVDKKSATFNQIEPTSPPPSGYEYRFTGTFTDKDNLSGTFERLAGGIVLETGTWTMVRGATAAANMSLQSISKTTKDQDD